MDYIQRKSECFNKKEKAAEAIFNAPGTYNALSGFKNYRQLQTVIFSAMAVNIK